MKTRQRASTRATARPDPCPGALSRWEDAPRTATLVAHGLAGGYGHRILFEGIDLTVGPGDVLGIVGANGAG